MQRPYDRPAETTLPLPDTKAPADAVLLFDLFLFCPELIDGWDRRVFVAAEFEVALDRARSRDLTMFGSTAELERCHRERYGPAQKFYFDTTRPTELAKIIVYNDEPEQPAWET